MARAQITYPEPATQSTGEKLMSNVPKGATKSPKRLASNGWQDKRLPAEKKTISPLLG